MILTNNQLKSMIFKYGNFIDTEEMVELIKESESFKSDLQFMVFDLNGSEIIIEYDICGWGIFQRFSGDYYTEPFYECSIEETEMTINSITIDDYDVGLTDEIENIVKTIIDKNL